MVAAFLIAYGAKFMSLKNKHGFPLLAQELRSLTPDKTILRAIVKSLVKLPTLESLGIIYSGHDIQLRRFGAGASKHEWYNAKYEWYMNIAKQPRSLQHYCRCAVRETLGINRLKLMDNLPLPTTLREYLLLEYDEYR